MILLRNTEKLEFYKQLDVKIKFPVEEFIINEKMEKLRRQS
jgi:hypothetical protein